MKTLIEGYRSLPGEHCGSVAMRGLLRHYCGLELSEPAVFGLGAGLDCVFLAGSGLDPARLVFGRTISMEVDLGRALGVDYREQPEPDDARAWQVVREEVLAGRPTMLSGDIFYLDYRDYKVHFPGHRFVLVGFDDERQIAWIADRIRPEPEACSYGALATSRNPAEGMSTQNLWGRFHDTKPGRSLPDAARWAIRLCARRMLGDAQPQPTGSLAPADARVATGLAGIRALAEDLPRWPARDDARWLASYNGRAIEKFGNGGGNFRRLYAGFLGWASELAPGLVPESAPALARRSADEWTALAADLAVASEAEAGPGLWAGAAKRAGRIAEMEAELFGGLAETSAA